MMASSCAGLRGPPRQRPTGTYRLHHAERHAGGAAARDRAERDRKLDAERTQPSPSKPLDDSSRVVPQCVGHHHPLCPHHTNQTNQ